MFFKFNKLKTWQIEKICKQKTFLQKLLNMVSIYKTLDLKISQPPPLPLEDLGILKLISPLPKNLIFSSPPPLTIFQGED